MPDYNHWTLDIDNENIAWLLMDVKDSSANILNRPVLVELDSIISEIEKNQTLKGFCLLSGKKGGFVYGADINEFATLNNYDEAAEFIKFGQEIFNRIEKLTIPTSVGIDGIAVGGGLEIALPFKHIILTDNPKTQIGFPEVTLGILPGYGGTGRTTKRAGTEKTLQMVLSGKLIKAQEALDWGIADEIVPVDALKISVKNSLNSKTYSLFEETEDEVLSIIEKSNKILSEQSYEDQTPAPFKILDHFKQSKGNGDKLNNLEVETFSRLLLTEASFHLRKVFQMTDAVKKSAKGDSNIKNIHIVGAGTMGGDIAAVAAMQGFNITITDQDKNVLDKAYNRAKLLYERRIKNENLVEKALSRFVLDFEGEGAKNADIIIEAVAEVLEVKQKVFSNLEKIAPKHAILATNTSSIMLEDISKVLNDPSRLIGLHFFNPVPVLPLVEVIFSETSRKDFIERAMFFSGQLRKMPIKCKSVKGFLVNRALLPYLFQGIVEMIDGTNPDKIDEALTRFGMPMGPIELCDQIGLDVCRDVGLVLGMPEKASKVLEEKLNANKFGRKSGEGFYKWDGKKPDRPRNKYDLVELDKLSKKLIQPMIDMCKSAVEQNVVPSKEKADIGCILGVGFPRFKGGPIGWYEYKR